MIAICGSIFCEKNQGMGEVYSVFLKPLCFVVLNKLYIEMQKYRGRVGRGT